MMKYVSVDGNQAVLGMNWEGFKILDTEQAMDSLALIAKDLIQASLETSLSECEECNSFEILVKGCVVEHVPGISTECVYSTDLSLSMLVGLKPSVQVPTSAEDYKVYFNLQVEGETIPLIQEVESIQEEHLLSSFETALNRFKTKVEALLA